MSANIDPYPATWHEMASRIEYADLRIDTQERDLRLLCLEAEKYRIPVVVVNPVNVGLAYQFAQPCGIKVAAAVSYPVGAYIPQSKMVEVEDAIIDGAEIIYMVMAVGAYLSGWIDLFTRPEITSLVQVAGGRPTRLITEASVLNKDQQRELCRIAIEAGVDDLVLCTGFISGKLPPVSDEQIANIVEAAGNKIGVAYMGEIDPPERSFALMRMGVTRLCTPSARNILAAYPDFSWAA